MGALGTKEAGAAYPPNPHYSCFHAHEEYIKTHKPPERRLITKFVYHAALRVSALGAYSPWKAPLDSKQGHSTQPTAAPSPAPPSASPAPVPATCQWHRAIFRAAPRSPSRSYSPSSLRAAVAVPGAHASGDEGARWYALRSVCFEVEARCVQNADLRGGGMSRMRPVSRPKACPPDYPTASSRAQPSVCVHGNGPDSNCGCQLRVEHGVQAATQRTRVRRVWCPSLGNEMRAGSAYRMPQTLQYTLRHQQEVNTRETGHSLAPCRIVGAAWAPPRRKKISDCAVNESRNGPVFTRR